MLCEMPEDEALRALAGFRASGARYLIASTRAHTGDDAPLVSDLLSAPFNLPLPRTFVLDGHGAVLGVWPLADSELTASD
ncbi:MAG TPA: hypothetical protein DEB56_05500 [Thiobacillus sp.]|nr:hypothetical protein [Thiobacillus sp.]